MSSRLIESLATTDALADHFSDRAVLEAMLAFEVALARVEARLGIIPAPAAAAIARAATAGRFDARAIAQAARRSGTIAIPFVETLTDLVRAEDPAAAGYVHWGATSQDVVDTALVLVLARAHDAMAIDHERLADALVALSDRHAGTVMVGRTLLQPALPVTFGLKVAGWYGSAARSWSGVVTAMEGARVPQFGGAAGTLAALGDRGLDVATGLAQELGLSDVAAPWHPHRDRLAAVVAAQGIYVGALGKIARDIALLMQDEVGEAAEPGGNSSTLPQKRNPAGAAIVLAAATRVPGLVAGFLAGMVQEHERAVGGWHAEWPTVAAVAQATGSAVASLADVAGALDVAPDRMRQHVEASRGPICAERVALRLAPVVGRSRAHDVVRAALVTSRSEGRALPDVLAAMPEVTGVMSADEIRDVDRPESYLGVAEQLRRRLLAETPRAARVIPPGT